MKDSPLISIAVPVYNSAKFLEKCLDSILAQTYTNLEVVVLNNGSTDNSFDIISRYQEKDSRIKSFTISHVPTETWSRNNAYIRTIAEWVVPVDSDDSIEPEYVEKLWNRHLETGAEWIGTTMTHIDEEGSIHGRTPKDYFDYSQVLKGKDAVILTLKGWQINGNGALIHRSLVPCIASGETKPLYNVEYDTRIILYYAKTVAFVDVKYFFGFNPNSFGRKPSYSKVTYVLHSYVGLLPFIFRNYGESSKETKIINEISCSFLIRAFKNVTKNKNLMTKEQKIEYKSMYYRLYENTNIDLLDESWFMKHFYAFAIRANIFILKFC